MTPSPLHEPDDVGAGEIPPLQPHLIVLVGATGDLARRKLLPGLLHLIRSGLLPDCRIVGAARAMMAPISSTPAATSTAGFRPST